MSIVFVLTDKGWKDQDAVTLNDGVYCFDLASGSLDYRKLGRIEDVSTFDTFRIFNHNSRYETYCNAHNELVLLNDATHSYYRASVADVDQRCGEFDIFVPCKLNGLTNNVRASSSDERRARFVKDVKKRTVALTHFEMTQRDALTFLDHWNNQYQRLNAVDYNQALMLQLVMLKGGYLSYIEQEIGFNVKRFQAESVVVGDVEKSNDVKITTKFYDQDGNPLNVICQIKNKVAIC